MLKLTMVLNPNTIIKVLNEFFFLYCIFVLKQNLIPSF